MDEHTRRPLTDEEMLKLEGNVVTRCYHLLIVQPVIMIHPANLPLSDRDKNLCSVNKFNLLEINREIDANLAELSVFVELQLNNS